MHSRIATRKCFDPKIFMNQRDTIKKVDYLTTTIVIKITVNEIYRDY